MDVHVRDECFHLHVASPHSSHLPSILTRKCVKAKSCSLASWLLAKTLWTLCLQRLRHFTFLSSLTQLPAPHRQKVSTGGMNINARQMVLMFHPVKLLPLQISHQESRNEDVSGAREWNFNSVASRSSKDERLLTQTSSRATKLATR